MSPSRVHVEAPAGWDTLEVAQAIVGPDVLLKAQAAHRGTQPRFRPLRELLARFQAAYEAHLGRMADAITAYVEREVIHQKLEKAGARPDPVISPEQLEELVALIQDYHKGFLVGTGLADLVDQDEIERLVSLGLLPPESFELIQDAFTMGQLSASAQSVEAQGKLNTTTYDSFKKQVKKTPVPLTENERRALDWSKHSTAIHIRGMGAQVADDVSTYVVAEDAEVRRKYMAVVRDEVQQGLEERKAWRSISSRIRHETEDWSRDMMRIAATETQMAFQEGFAENLVKREGDPDAIRVAKIPAPGACKHCIRLHLTEGVGSPPRIFKLSELTENGTNVGRKQAEWKPVVGPVHPWCACSLIHLPPGFSFASKPPEGEGWQRVRGKKSAYRKKQGEDWKYWSPEMVPDSMRKGVAFDCDLAKSFMTFGESAPVKGCSIRVSDPSLAQVVDRVVAKTPAALFDRDVGITVITTDTPRVGNAMDAHDLAYWTGNEIRLSQALPVDQAEYVLQHELGHAPNVYLVRKLGSTQAVRDWHDGLFELARQEGFVSKYARTLPIECAAEVTRMYMFDRKRLVLDYPRQFAYARRVYKGVLD